jgi:hypothetical protein
MFVPIIRPDRPAEPYTEAIRAVAGHDHCERERGNHGKPVSKFCIKISRKYHRDAPRIIRVFSGKAKTKQKKTAQ